MKASFKYPCLHIGNFFKICLDGEVKVDVSWEASKQFMAVGLIDEMIQFFRHLFRESKMFEVDETKYDGVLVPVVSFTGKYKASFIVPYKLSFRGDGVYGDIFAKLGAEGRGFINADIVSFTERGDADYITEKLIDLALDFNFPLPANFLVPVVVGDKLVLEDPNGNVVFWLNPRSYYLGYSVLYGKIGKKATFLKWLEDVIAEEVKTDLKKYLVRGDVMEISAGNFTIFYDVNKKMVIDFLFMTDQVNLFMVLNGNKIIIRDKNEKVRIDVDLGKRGFGSELWNFLKFFHI